MTPAPRSGFPPPLASPLKRGTIGIIVAWHAGCIVLGQMACFVTTPISYIEDNQPPEFDPPAVPEGEDFEVFRDRDFSVIAHDPDSDDTLIFFWDISGEPLSNIPTAYENGDVQDAVVVPWDLDYNGEVLNCTVKDSDGGRAELSWPIVGL